MGYALHNIGRQDTRYTVFENNQVLTADQLNDLHHYLNVQDRASRTKIIGVGIIGGLEIGLLDNGTMVLGRGAAITTDGDLAWYDDDVEFNTFRRFDDKDAAYEVFSGQPAIMYELLQAPRRTARAVTTNDTLPAGEPLSRFQAVTQTKLQDYNGILYLEEYTFDPDQCTGADCDNKGKEIIRNWRVLLVHKKDVALFNEALPQLNQSYFALPDIRIPRVVVNPAVDKSEELRSSFESPLQVMNDITAALDSLWVHTGHLAADLLGANPAAAWKQTIAAQVADMRKTWNLQYLYDYARDLSDAYHELKDLLFEDNVLLCPEVGLFPKHILLGAVKSAAVQAEPVTDRTKPVRAFGKYRFNLDVLLHRFTVKDTDDPARHDFYESPILNAKGEKLQQIRFGLMRLDAMIKCFGIPARATLGNADAIRITPGHYLDQPLGSRPIPFYYGFAAASRTLPAYWSYQANVRRREQQHRSYFAGRYSSDPFVVSPFLYDVSECNFYRIEGHIGLPYTDVEKKLNSLITTHNLPINIMTVQVEKNLLTAPVKPWWFKHLNFYEFVQRRSIVEQLQQAETTHNNLRDELQKDPARNQDFLMIKPVVEQFNAAKTTFMAKYAAGSRPPKDTNATKDFETLTKTAASFKAGTKQFGFSNTAAPHDFVINTNAHIKLDMINDLIKDQIRKKQEDLFLGNFLVKNPGLEHAAGVLRGGTFVLVYTSSDNLVVADFMLPYASVDADVEAEVRMPEVKPMPVIPRFEIPLLWEKIPPFEKLLDVKVKEWDGRFARFDADWANKVKILDEDMNKRILNTQTLFTNQIMNFDKRFGEVNDTVNNRLITLVNLKSEELRKDFTSNVQKTLLAEQNSFYKQWFVNAKATDGKGGGIVVDDKPGRGKFQFGEIDIEEDVRKMNDLIRELAGAGPNARPKLEEETQRVIQVIQNKVTKAAAAGWVADTERAVIKDVMEDINRAGSNIANPVVKKNITESGLQMRNIVLRG